MIKDNKAKLKLQEKILQKQLSKLNKEQIKTIITFYKEYYRLRFKEEIT